MKKINAKKIVVPGLLSLIIILIILGIISYVNYKNNNQGNKTEINEGKYQTLDGTDDLVKDLFYLTRGSNTSSLFYGTNYNNIYYIDDNLDINSLDNNFKMMLSFLTIEDNKKKNDNNGSQTIWAEYIKDRYITIFGKKDNYVDEDIYYFCPSVISYNITDKQYEIDGGCGYIATTGYTNKLLYARKYEDRIEIYETVAFYLLDIESEKISYFINGNYSDILTTLSVDEKFKIDDYLEKLHIYKYTFVKNDKNYNFSKVEKVK